MVERGSSERQYPLTWRNKSGLETPLVSRIYGENKRLTFAPPYWYDVLVVVCFLGGLVVLVGAFGIATIPWISNSDVPFAFIGSMVCLAGVWAALSNERMACDLRAGTYARLEGQGFRKRITRGGLNELQAIVLMSQEIPSPGLSRRYVIYRLVLYWKNSKEPLLVVARDERWVPIGQPINAAAGVIAQYGHLYSRNLGVQFYDNSYLNSAGPLPAV